MTIFHLKQASALLCGLAGLTLTVGASAASPTASQAVTDKQLQKIQHVVVIYGENRSFDNLYGLFPGANGIADAKLGVVQVDNDGTPLARLPDVWKGKPPVADPSYPRLPNQPFRLDDAQVHKPFTVETADLVHRFYQNQEQIDGGKMDKYVAVSDAGALTMGYYDGSAMKLWNIARQYTLADNFFMGAFGGSFLHAGLPECAGLEGGGARWRQQAGPQADFTGQRAGWPAAICAGWRGDAGRLRRQYAAVVVPAVGHSACCRWR